MNGFSLPNNFIDDPERLIRRKKFVEAWDIFDSPPRTPTAAQASSLGELAITLEEELGDNLAPLFEDMTEKTLREFSTPTKANIRTEPAVNIGENGIELKPTLITMVQASQFYGKAHEDASAHLQHFL